jgi:hypothetical protein
MHRLIRGLEQLFEVELTGGTTEAAGMGQAEQFEAGVIDQLKQVFAVEGKEGRVHDLENAAKKSCGFKRANALFLEEIGQRIDLGGEFADGVARGGSASAKGIVALAQ